MTPRDRHEGRKQSTTEAQKKAQAVLKQVRLGLEGTEDTSKALLAEPWSSRLAGKAAMNSQFDPLPQADRRQSMAFNILNTPKKLGNSLLRRGASKKAQSKASPNTRSGTRRSPRIATTTASAATASAATTTPRAKGKVEALTGAEAQALRRAAARTGPSQATAELKSVPGSGNSSLLSERS